MSLLYCLVACLLLSCSRQQEAPAAEELIIISPHGSDIRREFEWGFAEWHEKKYGTRVNIKWPDIGGGGTGNIVQYLDGEYRKGKSCGYDLFFGGGSFVFQDCRSRGYLQPPDLTPEVLTQVPKDIFNTPLRAGDDTWIAATMANFGICYNKDRLQELGLNLPNSWQDLAGPGWFGHLSLADPSKSGSVRTSYEQIFLQYGWEKGWGIIVRMFANADNIRVSGSAPADDVGAAQAVAGIVIDFYGRKEVLRVGEPVAGFLIPEGGSVTDADPIAVLKGAPHPTLAAHFIEFVISEPGQKLWTFKAGTPGGPRKYVLGRLSVLPDLYRSGKEHMFDPRSPFESAASLKGDEVYGKARVAFMGELIRAALLENHGELVAARRALRDAGDPPDLVAMLDELPTFIQTQVVEGKLVDQPRRPISKEDQKAVAAEFKPSDPVRKASMERLQRRLIDTWQTEYNSRFREIQAQARASAKR